MEKFVVAITTALLSLTQFSLDTETADERVSRMQSNAVYIDAAVDRATCTGEWSHKEGCRRVWNGSKRELAAAIISLGHHETHYAQAIYEGHCHTLPEGMRCDNGMARSYWQQWQVACPEVWKTEPGSAEEVEVGAWCAARLLSSAYKMCRGETEDDWAAAFMRYGGKSCKAPGGKARAATLRRVLTKL